MRDYLRELGPESGPIMPQATLEDLDAEIEKSERELAMLGQGRRVGDGLALREQIRIRSWWIERMIAQRDAIVSESGFVAFFWVMRTVLLVVLLLALFVAVHTALKFYGVIS